MKAIRFLHRRGKTLSYLRTLVILTAIIAVGVLSSCSKEGDTIFKPDPNERQASTAPLVTVVYDADGVGDQSYNDLIYQGVEEAALRYGLRTLQLSPQTHAEGLAILERLFEQMSTANDTVRRLCIVTSPVYDEFVRKNNSRLERNERASLLYLDTATPLEGKGSTLHLPYYGAMYEAGNIAPLFAVYVTFFGANPVSELVAEALKGFTDGFNDRQDDIESSADTDDIGFQEGFLQVQYLGEKADEGFNIDDEKALILLKDNDITNMYSNMIVPLCGGAASVFTRFADITSAYTYMGINNPQTSIYSPCSVVKHIDRAVIKCIGQWLSAESMPKHQSLGLSSGYTEVVLHPYSNFAKTTVQKYLTDAVMNEIHQQAIRKEEAYEK